MPLFAGLPAALLISFPVHFISFHSFLLPFLLQIQSLYFSISFLCLPFPFRASLTTAANAGNNDQQQNDREWHSSSEYEQRSDTHTQTTRVSLNVSGEWRGYLFMLFSLPLTSIHSPTHLTVNSPTLSLLSFSHSVPVSFD